MSNSMKINTRDLGEVSIYDNDIITFQNGLFGFEDKSRFVLIDVINKQGAPLWLQSVDAPSLCFIVFDTRSIISGYEPQALQEDLDLVGIDNIDEAKIFSIASIGDDIRKTTINLKSPVIINSNNNMGVQAILSNDYELRYRLYQNA